MDKYYLLKLHIVIAGNNMSVENRLSMLVKVLCSKNSRKLRAAWYIHAPEKTKFFTITIKTTFIF